MQNGAKDIMLNPAKSWESIRNMGLALGKRDY
jgi:hypothetical protein